MDARLFGFRLRTQNCSVEQLSEYLKNIHGKSFSFHSRDRMLFCGMTQKNRCAGVLITLKDQRRFPEIEHGKEFTLHIHEAEEGRTPFDFNFFTFDPQTGAGLYQHYSGSCSLLRFGMLLSQLYDDIARNDCCGDSHTLNSRSTMRRLRNDQLDFSLVMERQNFEEMLKSLREAKKFEYDVCSVKDMSSSSQPLSGMAKLERRTVTFKPGVSGKDILPSVMKLTDFAKGNSRFRVVGTDDEGDLRRLDLLNPPVTEFRKDNVDELADETVLNFGDIVASPYIDKMEEELDRNSTLFSAEED